MFWRFSIIILFLINCIQAEEKSHCFITLIEAERIALQNNKQVQATEALLEKARFGRLESFSKWLPSLQAMSEGWRTQFNQQPLLNAKQSFDTLLSLTQTLFSMDRYYGLKIAELYVEQLCLLLEAAKNDVLYLTRESYYKVILDRKIIKTTKHKVNLLRALAKQMEGRYSIGEAIMYDVNQSKVAVANALTAYYVAIKNYKSDFDILVKVLGFDPATAQICLAEQDIPIDKIPMLSCKLHILDQLFAKKGVEQEIFLSGFSEEDERRMSHLFTCSEMLSWEMLANKKRPDILLGRNYLKIACQNINRKEGEYFPTVDLIGNYGGLPMPYVPYLKEDFFGQSFSWGVGVKMNWLLFDSFGREARIGEAKAEEWAQSFFFQKTIQEAHTEVRNEIYTIEEAVSSYTTSAANVLLAEELVREAHDQLQIGYITVYDYEISVNQLIQAERTRDQASYDLIAAYYGLRHATGIDLNCNCNR